MHARNFINVFYGHIYFRFSLYTLSTSSFAFPTCPEEVDHIECFDVYTGEQIKEGFKSMAYAIYYRHPERTLTEEEINTKHAAIQTALKQKLAAEIR
jgi:hypothetical protein